MMRMDKPAISIVIPTRNRAYTLEKIFPFLLVQKYVQQVIVIDDAGCDATRQVVDTFAASYPSIVFTYRKNPERKGAPFGRNLGVKLARHPFLLFCDDDVFLEENYTHVLVNKLFKDKQAGVVSGRYVQLQENESVSCARRRFGNGDKRIAGAFSCTKFAFVADAYFTEDVSLPLTQPVILTYTALLRRFPYDEYYAKGNGFREESDAQVQIFLAGYKVIMSSDTRCYHMSPKTALTGGQRRGRLSRFLSNVYYTFYFYKKYYKELKKKLSLRYPFSVAIVLFTFHQLYEQFFPSMGLRKYFFWNRTM